MMGAPVSLQHRLRNAIYLRLMTAGPYAWRLSRQAPTGLVFAPHDPWPGDVEIANNLFRGIYSFAGEEHEAVGQPPWSLIETDSVGADWTIEAFSFSWLRHFNASQSATAARNARALIDTWIELYGNWHPLAWRPDILARRLIAWLVHSAFLLDGAGPEFRERWLASLSRQFRHLVRKAGSSTSGEERLHALSGVVIGGLCLPGGGVRAGVALKKLVREIEHQILADGGHVSRSPASLFNVLNDLIMVRVALKVANRETPFLLQNTLDRMGPMLGLFRHGDGRLALFNGAHEATAAGIDMSLELAGAQGAARENAPNSGFQRLSADSTVIIADTGAPPTGALSRNVHAGTLGFEMSVGVFRMIVNCGSGAGIASRATAAHSTLVMDDTSSSLFKRRGRHRGEITGNPLNVTASREEANGSVWLDLEHDGYAGKFGILHRRRLYLDTKGGDLRGEDLITMATGVKGRTPNPSGNVPLAVRFHLHPDVSASLSQDGTTAVVRLPDGDGWQLRASGGALSLTESIYFGERGRVRRSEQIVITGTVEFGEATIKWALRRVRNNGGS